MRLSGTKTGTVNQYRGLGNQLWDLAGNRPSLDLPFSDTKSLVDTTTGKTLVDHTRASSGTYVDGDGLIKTAVTNLLLRSEEFDQSPWAASTGVTVTANAEIAPDGTLTAARVQWDAANKSLSQTIAVTSGLIYQFSVWVKGAAGESIRLSGPTGENYTLTGDWQRISLINTPSSSSQGYSLNTFGGATARDLYVWGAQLEQSSTVGEYIKTTSTINSAPRFDHDPTTGESLGLLVEESRTNLLTYSEEFDNGAWSKSQIQNFGSGSIVDAIASPDGSITADFVAENTATAIHRVQRSSLSITLGTSYTVSVYAKSTNRNLYLNMAAHFGARANFNLLTGEINSSSGVASALDVGGGWYRCSLTGTALSTKTTAGFFFQINTNTNDTDENYTGDGTSGIYLWGAQLEAGSLPTSYIPTEGSTVTRAADVASISGSNFSGWYNEAVGSFYSESSILGLNAIGSTRYANGVFKVRNNTVNNSFSRTHHYSPDVNMKLMAGARDSSGIQFLSVSATQTANTLYKAASAFTNGTADAALCINGSTPGINLGTTCTLSGSTTLLVGAGYFGGIGGGAPGGDSMYLNGTLKRLSFWPQRLPNETLQTITQ